MDLEELKKSWQLQTIKLEKLEEQNRKLLNSLRENRVNTARSKLLHTYSMLLIISIIMVPFIIFTFPYIEIPCRVTVVLTITMMVMAICNAYVYRLIYQLNLTDMTMRVMLRRVLFLERTRQRIRWATISIAVVVVGLLLSHLYTSQVSAFWGGITGGIIGAVVGLRKESEIKQIIRMMKRDLEDALTDE